MLLNLYNLKRARIPPVNEKTSINNSLIIDAATNYLFKLIKTSPELLAMLDDYISKCFLTEVDFFKPNGKPLSVSMEKKVKQFWRDSKIQTRVFYGMAFDLLVDGSSFGWYVTPSTVLDKTIVDNIPRISALYPQISEEITFGTHIPKTVDYLPTSTITIKVNEYGTEYYVQTVNGKKYKWDLNQVVHIKRMEIENKVKGFSPVKALIKELLIMLMVKENIISQVENGGTPDHLISLKNSMGSRRAKFERLKIALESFGHLRNSHGNLALEDEVIVSKISSNLKDMEYRELSMYIISQFALSIGLPTSQIPFMMTGSGGTTNKGMLSGASEEGLQKKFNILRSKLENGWNTIFSRAGFIFKYRRDNLQDDVRETQASLQRVGYAKEINKSLYPYGKKLTTTAQLDVISGRKKNITLEDIEDLKSNDLINSSPFMVGANKEDMNGSSVPLNKASLTGYEPRNKQEFVESKKATATNKGVYL